MGTACWPYLFASFEITCDVSADIIIAQRFQLNEKLKSIILAVLTESIEFKK